ncbi:balbiani ring protein 3-like [Ptychodera flava]|uniref:balbiani ring protein 3-like n=1 Tax=Ptychodera flava TaxID=63121 RepID=UPI003969FD90
MDVALDQETNSIHIDFFCVSQFQISSLLSYVDVLFLTEIVPADEPPCRKELQDMPNPFPQGMMVPRCTEEGYYDKEQCHDGQCWCTYKNGNEVENTRRRGRAPCNKEGTCPAADPNTLGSCVEECSRDHDCEEDMKCCSNGCGHVCVSMTAERPGKCPAQEPGSLGTCVELCGSDNDCPLNHKCCSNGCGHDCMSVDPDDVDVDGSGDDDVRDLVKAEKVTLENMLEKLRSRLGAVLDKNLIGQIQDVDNKGNVKDVIDANALAGILNDDALQNLDEKLDAFVNSGGTIADLVDEVDEFLKPENVVPDEPPCNVELRQAYDSGSRDVFFPRCSQDGFYEKEQCWHSKRECWCTTRLGKEVDGTRRQGRTNCDKEGTCPALEDSIFGSCIEECAFDYDCSGDAKCCSNGCGHTCVSLKAKDDVNKPGECPFVRGNDGFGICVEECSSDGDCSGEDKCCSNGCGHTCVKPLKVADIKKPGECPVASGGGGFGICVEECSSDGDCSGDEKCCSNGCGHTCVKPVQVSDVEKPGECPVASGDRGFGICVEECSSDSDCSGEDKCCSNGCGHTCVKPLKVADIKKPGECPVASGGGGFGICVEECSSDGDCSGDEKCCSNGCGHTCVKPLQVSDVEKPGECPVASGDRGFGICVEECSSDSDCSGEDKCCSNGCGHTCVKPLKVADIKKPGECPVASGGGGFGICVEECSSDGDCSGDEKCCSNGCGHTCVKPLQVSDVEKPGECPVASGDRGFGICVEECSSDSDCSGEDKCCSNGCGHTCVKPLKVADIKKPGECPVASGGGGFGICVEECSSDGDCSGDEKCCSNGCGHTCVKPLKVADIKKPGECPFAGGGGDFGICVEECSSDGDCSGDEKCCSNGCGHTCVKPVQVSDVEKPGECPFVRGNDRVGICVEECSSDGDCSSDEKCCSNGCGHTCVKPLGVVDVEKPGECPVASGGGGFGICLEECSSDGDCSGDEKCCSNGCGHTCVKPLKVADVVEKPGECPFVRGNDRVGICVEECSSDGDCSGKDKCCSNGCGHTCVKPLGVSDVEKPGECPVASGDRGFGICVEECSSDGDCSGDEKCCSNGCGHTCVKPLQVSDVRFKPGECPVASGDRGFGICVEECSSDGDCSGKDKCCSNGCGHTCVKPLGVSDVEKPGECPVAGGGGGFGICVEECSSDGDCSGDEKCCSNGCGHTCVKPVQVSDVVEKPGECPFVRGNDRVGICVEECSSDGDCSGKDKCCSNGCGHTCVKPFGVSDVEKPGECPVASGGGGFGICVEECSSDGDCSGDEKCCSNGCGHTCVKPLQVSDVEKPGECPVVHGNDGFGICVEECSSDSDCSGDEKCCSNGCGHTCVRPLQVADIEKPGECPFVRGNDRVGICVEECSSDGDCSGKDKCCSNGCGHTCVKPLGVSDVKKLGECPAASGDQGFGICVEECSSDGDCSGDEKCCSNGCGHTCVKPLAVPEKPGTCPPTQSGSLGTCVEECRNDHDCQEDQKCCSNGCGHVCLHAIYIQDIEKPGECPFVRGNDGFGTCVEECSSDGDCSGDEKCCSNGCGHTCVKPLAVPEKPGTCPAVQSDSIGACVEECRDDYDCQGDQKCCSNGCGHVCRHTIDVKVPEKEGRCPAVGLGVGGICVEDCNNDFDCEGDEKCCSNGCGHTCIRPQVSVIIKSGECPAVEKGAFGTCFEFCTHDGDCPGTDKCCSNGCGHTCVSPAKKEKPGSCPAVEPGVSGVCIEFCSSDDDCIAEEKCCSNGCGHICLPPFDLGGGGGGDNRKDEGDLPDCQKELQEVQRRGSPPGSFTPTCAGDGYYHKKQCYHSIGYCWCSSKDGEEVAGTRTNVRYGDTLDCDKPGTCPAVEPGYFGSCAELCTYDHDCPGDEKCCSNGCGHSCIRVPAEVDLPPCHKELRDADRQGPLLGAFKPTCRDDGYYDKKQCHKSIGYCWCTNKDGEEVEGTRTNVRTGDNLVCDKPGTCPAVEPAGSYGSCAELCTYDHDCPGDEKCCSNGCGHSCIRAQPEEELPPCHKELKEVKSRGRLIGAFKPRCTDDGYYQKKQCWGSTGHCWCASKDGQEVEGTKTRGPLECDKPGTCPAVQSDSVGICAELCDYDHDCDGEEKCCSNGCGHVCVRIEPSEPPCTAAVREAYANFVQGKHIPYCDEDGYYEKEQCDPTTRECWCSDRYGKEVEGSRQRGRTRC